MSFALWKTAEKLLFLSGAEMSPITEGRRVTGAPGALPGEEISPVTEGRRVTGALGALPGLSSPPFPCVFLRALGDGRRLVAFLFVYFLATCYLRHMCLARLRFEMIAGLLIRVGGFRKSLRVVPLEAAHFMS